MEQCIIEMEILTKDNGKIIKFGVKVFFTLKMEITMKEILLMETLKGMGLCSLLE